MIWPVSHVVIVSNNSVSYTIVVILIVNICKNEGTVCLSFMCGRPQLLGMSAFVAFTRGRLVSFEESFGLMGTRFSVLVDSNVAA